MRVLCCVTLLLLASSVGCLPEDEPLPISKPPAATPAPAEEVTPEGGSATEEEGSATQEQDAATQGEGSATRDEGPAARQSEPVVVPAVEPATSDETGAAAQPGMKRVKADVGVGKKGRSLDEYDSGVEGAIAGPARAYFGFREKAIFQMQIPNAMRLYKGANGTNPKSHDEFMSKIIEANNIQLPELNAGQKYVYDPEKAELMVERPR